MQETAAWLAIWDEDVGREVARREPSLLLLAGDPASLPASVREAVLADVVERLAAGGPRVPLHDHDNVKRFARADLAVTIRRLWSKHQGHPEARELLLWMIWLGELKECADLAESAAYGAFPEQHPWIVAGLALAAAGDDAMKRRYVGYIRANCATLPKTLTLNAIDGLFPDPLSVADLLDIFAQIDIADADGGLSVEWQAPGWIDRLSTRPELENVLRGLLVRTRPGTAGYRAHS